FVNKMDREAQDTFDLIEEVQDKLALDAAPLQWPAGSGNRFKGVADLGTDELLLYRRPGTDEEDEPSPEAGAKRMRLDGNSVTGILSAEELDELQAEASLAQESFAPFDLTSFREGHLTPVLFGSALRQFGVRELIDALAKVAPGPEPVDTVGGDPAAPDGEEVAGFIFKVQANMDPNHRDRVAFLRLVSGRFRRGMKLKPASTGKPITVSSPILFFAQDREIADEAFAGDVIGVPNHGVLRVGDSLSETGKLRFAGIPNFAPEILRRARVADPLKAKHLRKALEGLAEEGITQLFRPAIGADMIVGAVGVLQFDVMAERLKAEYGLEVDFEVPPYETARWLAADDPAVLEAFAGKNRGQMAEDLDGAPVYLAKNSWEAGYAEEKNPEVRFLKSKERQA
ncbi:MAG: peptide chain release factor 3, partial [Caulobacterales bacterium]|nr:peptide chain release factor 3 [Caulobacterales bacterium]